MSTPATPRRPIEICHSDRARKRGTSCHIGRASPGDSATRFVFGPQDIAKHTVTRGARFRGKFAFETLFLFHSSIIRDNVHTVRIRTLVGDVGLHEDPVCRLTGRRLIPIDRQIDLSLSPCVEIDRPSGQPADPRRLHVQGERTYIKRLRSRTPYSKYINVPVSSMSRERLPLSLSEFSDDKMAHNPYNHLTLQLMLWSPRSLSITRCIRLTAPETAGFSSLQPMEETRAGVCRARSTSDTIWLLD